ncbi:MAG TPA: nucleotidyltransferase family protein [Thermodesulfovibrionales bacterium]|nr:nucleotidyltransferase family protein [Thermodesulfovibrionales bacterium]
MGQLKQLLPLGDKPIIRYCLDSLIDAGIEDLVVVLGPRGNEILDTIKDLPVKIVFNKNPESEMAESVRIGLRTIAESSSGVLVSLSDHPLVKADTFKKIVHCHFETPDKILIPLYEGQRGHPSLFPKIIIEEVFAGLNLRDIIHNDPNRIRLLEVKDEGIVLDIDTREDYDKIRRNQY